MHYRSFLENYTIPDQNWRSLHPFSDQNGPKSLSFEAAHTYIVVKLKLIAS